MNTFPEHIINLCKSRDDTHANLPILADALEDLGMYECSKHFRLAQLCKFHNTDFICNIHDNCGCIIMLVLCNGLDYFPSNTMFQFVIANRIDVTEHYIKCKQEIDKFQHRI